MARRPPVRNPVTQHTPPNRMVPATYEDKVATTRADCEGRLATTSLERQVAAAFVWVKAFKDTSPVCDSDTKISTTDIPYIR